ncbi:MAG: hypothetical protein NTY20_02565 [Candidatus Aenigmarchaeota archaeon]|nr:hypothetical protein [Candidatus Aenigmarchaeota archaeon]
MQTETDFIEAKGKEAIGVNFIKTLLGTSGYKVSEFGLEHHNQEIITKIRGKYSSNTNKKIAAMPDLVVIDESTQEAWLLEIKYKSSFAPEKVAFSYKHMDDYREFWKEATLVIISPTPPYCICIDVNKIEPNQLKKIVNCKAGGCLEEWDFSNPKVYCSLIEKFTKVSEENFKKQLHLLGVKE